MKWVGILITLAILAPVIYLAIFGPVSRKYLGSSERDLSPWGNPDRDRVPGTRRRY
jgi:hypothetical protein